MTDIAERRERRWNGIVVGLYLLAIWGFLSYKFDFYYDLNDDVLIMDIFSGAYSGSPDAHSIQVIYLLGCVFSCLYRMVPQVPWFGILLMVGMWFSLWLIISKILLYVRVRWMKVATLAIGIVLIPTLFLTELIYIQYTVVSGIMLIAATVSFLSVPAGLSVKNFFKANIISILLVVVAFYLRPMMLLCMAPFICMAGFFHWRREVSFFRKENVKKYLGVVAAILLGIGIGVASESIGYGDEEWKEFQNFFDARTDVYDFSWYPLYEFAEDFYEEIGLSEAEYKLIYFYNIGLDECINEETLRQIADYGERQRSEPDLKAKIQIAVAEQVKRFATDMDRPYSRILISCYMMLIVLGVFVDKKALWWQIPCLLVGRMAPWMYLMMSKRVVDRVIHPLYWMEIVFLILWILKLYDENRDNSFLKKRSFLLLYATLLFAECICLVYRTYVRCGQLQADRQNKNEIYEMMEAYTGQHQENFYLLDVYSFTDYAEKVFSENNAEQNNYVSMGGWYAGSPLNKEILHTQLDFETDSLYEALLQSECFLIVHKDREWDYILDLYEEKDICVTAELVEQLEAGGDTFLVYQFVQQ